MKQDFLGVQRFCRNADFDLLEVRYRKPRLSRRHIAIIVALVVSMLAIPVAQAGAEPGSTVPLTIVTPPTSSLVPRTGPIRVYFSHPNHGDLQGHEVTLSTTLVDSRGVPVIPASTVTRSITAGNYVDVHYDGTTQFARQLLLRVSYPGSADIGPASTSLRKYDLGSGVVLHFQPPRTASLHQSGELVIPMVGNPRRGGAPGVVERIYMHVTVNGRRHSFDGFTNGEYGFVSYSLPESTIGERAEVVFTMDLSYHFAASSSSPRHYDIVK